MPLPLCVPGANLEICRALRELGRQWAADPARPVISNPTLQAWGRLIDEWVADETLPLLIRKFNRNRGSPLRSAFGRQLVPTDNSPAQWAFAVAYDGVCPTVGEVPDMLSSARIPVAMAFSAGEEKAGAVYRGLRGRCPGTADAGWKLAHLEPVGLGRRGPLEEFEREALEQHFRLLMSPANMLVVPAAWAGLSEVEEFLDGFRIGLADRLEDGGRHG
jgi:hypothetical protein